MWFRRVIMAPTCINFPTTATKREQHSQSNNCCNQACCFLGLYISLTTIAYSLIWQGAAWWIVLDITVSRAIDGGKFTYHNKVSSTCIHVYVYLPRPPFFIQNRSGHKTHQNTCVIIITRTHKNGQLE